MQEKQLADLNLAYINTNYVAQIGSNHVVIRIGEQNRELDCFLSQHDALEWAFITAYNPFSKQLLDRENEERQIELKHLLNKRGFVYFDGFGEAAKGGWAPEPSFLVFALNKEEAISIGRQFDQNAIVVGKIQSVPELVWIQAI